MGFNELKLAEFRIRYLQSYVNQTVILESGLTHSGHKKPHYFSEWLNSHTEFQSKVRVISVDLSQLDENWERERYSRRFLYEYILMNFPNSKFILSDLDEIPSCDQVRKYLECDTYMKFGCLTYFRRANFQVEGRGKMWHRGVFGSTHLPYIEQGGRFSKLPLVNSSSPGGHFSYLNYEEDSLSKKLESFAHQELNVEFIKSREYIEYCDKYSLVHIGGARYAGFGLLHKLTIEELSAIQKSLYCFDANFFDFKNIKVNLLSRIAAAIVVSTIINHPKSRNLIFKNLEQKRRGVSLHALVYIMIEAFHIAFCHLRELIRKRLRGVWNAKFCSSRSHQTMN
jgi:hypothetical protein